VKAIGGILASIGVNYFLTDPSWKCTTHNYAKWMQPNFDDSSWPAAVVSQTNSPDNPHHDLMSDVSANAKWIWTKNFVAPIADKNVYCRGYLRMFIRGGGKKLRRWSLLSRVHTHPAPAPHNATQDNARHRAALYVAVRHRT